MKFVVDDGGRKAAGFKGRNDCGVRAVAIVTGKPYAEVFEAMRASPSGTTWKRTRHDYLLSLGFRWVPTMGIGTGCKVHLRDGELPMGRLLVVVSHHLAAVIDGVLHDTHDCSREGNRCVYGYYVAEYREEKR